MKYEIKCPYCGNNQIYQPRKEPPKIPHTKCKECKREFNFEVNNPKKTIIEKASKKDQGHKFTPPVESDFIDDPDELLLSVAIRELNRANPDPRWASILINCKKENISNKEKVLDQFKQLPTQALVNLLSKSLQEE